MPKPLALAIPVCLLLLASAGLAAPVLAEKATAEVLVEKDIPYVESPHERQHLDLYVPKGEGPWPTLMWIHGGAWAVGHRKDEEALARRFAERGIAVAAVDHRMSKALWMKQGQKQGIEHPGHVEDCAAAFAWIARHAKERKLDPDRLFVGGFSSGAHLSALLATDPKYLKAHDLEPGRIRGALPVGGAYDMQAYYETHLEHNGEKMAEQHVLDVFGRGEGALKDASPATHVMKTEVPMLVLSEIHTVGYTKRFKDLVESKELDWIRFRHFADRTHGNICKGMARKEADPPRDLMIAFIRDPKAKLPEVAAEAPKPEAPRAE